MQYIDITEVMCTQINPVLTLFITNLLIKLNPGIVISSKKQLK